MSNSTFPVMLIPNKNSFVFSVLQVVQVIQNSLQVTQQLVSDVDLKLFMHDAFGKGLMKKCKTSPDAFIQMALQLAYYRVSRKMRPRKLFVKF